MVKRILAQAVVGTALLFQPAHGHAEEKDSLVGWVGQIGCDRGAIIKIDATLTSDMDHMPPLKIRATSTHEVHVDAIVQGTSGRAVNATISNTENISVHFVSYAIGLCIAQNMAVQLHQQPPFIPSHGSFPVKLIPIDDPAY